MDHSDSTSSDEEYVHGQKVKGQNVLATPAVRRLAIENKVDNSRNSEGFIHVPNPSLVLIAHCLIYTYKICLLNENVFELFQPKLRLSVGGNYVAQNNLSKSELLPDKQEHSQKIA